MDGKPGGAPGFVPDGLAGEVLDELIERAYAEAARAARPTSALVDGSAAERRRRRVQRRAVAAVVRALPVHQGGLGPEGWAA